MDTLTEVFNTALIAHMRTQHISQEALGAAVGKSQTWVSTRLRGATRWTLGDLHLLNTAGIPVGEFLYSRLPLGDMA